eukprot:Platyproteum_vivax@DN6574_c0_g1_i1.p1
MLGSMDFLFAVEKQAVVLDIGTCVTRIGFATEAYPRHVFNTDLAFRKSHPSKQRLCVSSQTTAEWITILEDFFKTVFFYYLQANPKERKVVICDKIFSPRPFRDAIAHVLFQKMKVPCIMYICDALLPLYLTGIPSGLIIDCGYEATRILPLFHGVPLYHAAVVLDIGGRNIDKVLHHLLLEHAQELAKAGVHKVASTGPHAPSATTLRKPLRPEMLKTDPSPNFQNAPTLLEVLNDLSDEMLEDIKTRACYIRCEIEPILPPPDPEKEPDGKPPKPAKKVVLHSELDTVYYVDSLTAIPLNAETRWKACEILFQAVAPPEDIAKAAAEAGGAEYVTLPPESLVQACVEAIRLAGVDCRRTITQNIALCGGVSSMRGFVPRFASELKLAMEKEKDLKNLVPSLGFATPPFPRPDWIWLGGSVYGSMEGTAEYTKAQYEAGDPVPDWLG